MNGVYTGCVCVACSFVLCLHICNRKPRLAALCLEATCLGAKHGLLQQPAAYAEVTGGSHLQPAEVTGGSHLQPTDFEVAYVHCTQPMESNICMQH